MRKNEDDRHYSMPNGSGFSVNKIELGGADRTKTIRPSEFEKGKLPETLRLETISQPADIEFQRTRFMRRLSRTGK